MYPLVYLALGAGLIGWALRQGLRERDKAARWLVAEATVTGTRVAERRRTPVQSRTTLYHVEIDFTDAGGRRHSLEADNPTGFRRWKIGDRVRVIYDPADPSRVETLEGERPVADLRGPVIAALIGAGFVVMGLT